MPRLFAAFNRLQSRAAHGGGRQAVDVTPRSRPWDDARFDVPTYLRRGLIIQGLPGWRR